MEPHALDSELYRLLAKGHVEGLNDRHPDGTPLNLRHADLCGVDLRGLRAAGLDLRDTDLRGVDLRETRLARIFHPGTR